VLSDSGRQVVVGLVELTRQQPGLAPQGHRESVPTPGTQPLGLRGERVGERDQLRVGHRPVQQTVGGAQVAIEHPDRQLGQTVGSVIRAAVA
jgi:hypothetical protein